ncbi:MAG: class I SAM-dependent methyltransferase [Deltaproteobacteria bacterium]|nr:class I SAM-dependent methyltransferase [Deltaproteobacteria bacterium]
MEILKSTEFYDRMARVFDIMTDWETRLAYEMPFFQRTLDRHNARRVLDTACGTGGHAIALARKGYRVTGCDASSGMIELARANAARAGVAVQRA